MNLDQLEKRASQGSVRLSLNAVLLFAVFLFLNRVLLASVQGAEPSYEPSGFIELLNGENLEGWKAAQNSESFQVEDGALLIQGKPGYLYYDGAANEHSWKDFHAQIVIQTKPKANSGIFIHTEYQKAGRPQKGYEIQIANTHPDPQKTGSIYSVSSENAQIAEDNDWFILDIYVRDRRVVTMINGRWSVNWLEPKEYQPPKGFEGRHLSQGTFAIEAHGSNGAVLIKSFRVRPLL